MDIILLATSNPSFLRSISIGNLRKMSISTSTKNVPLAKFADIVFRYAIQVLLSAVACLEYPARGELKFDE